MSASSSAADAGSSGWKDAGDADSSGQYETADAGSSRQEDAADAAARKKTEELKAAAEMAGKPVRKPDHTEVREALVKEDLKPSDGWSFGSFAAEVPAETAPETETAPAAEPADEEQDG